jgi:hypothetical protein
MKSPYEKMAQRLAVSSPKTSKLQTLILNLRGKPFYCASPSPAAYCCIWHTFPPIRPQDDQPSELHPFQQEIIADLEKFRKYASVKCRGAGLSELAIMYGLFLTLSKHASGNIYFITGIGYTLSRDLARRVREKFARHDVYFDDDNNTTLSFPSLGIRWEYFGSDSKSWRGRTRCIYLVCDELIGFDENSTSMASIDTYTVKHPSAIVWLITTPSYNVNGFAYKLFNEPDDSKVLYKRSYINYEKCLDTMLDRVAMKLLSETSPTFPVEYNLRWGYSQTGACFSPESIEAAITKPKYMFNPHADKILGIDLGFGSSATSYCIIQLSDGLVQVLHSTQLEKADINYAIIYALDLMRKYNPHHTYCDAAAPSFIRALKRAINEDEQFEQCIAMYRKMKVPYENNMIVVPVAFNAHHKDMLAFTKMCMDKELVSIDESICSKLVSELRLVTEKNGVVDKTINNLDEFDSFRLALFGVKL